ncbi:MAG: HD domain-containing protein [Candidatus Woesearchaeota archaeon]|jgi:putative nucleotidyltransferase with HDIG domain|nr:HD domain-containing protein [Candidatus Woesearchaeota archaeon]
MNARTFFEEIIEEPNIKKYLDFLKYHHNETYEHSLRVGMYSTIIAFNKLLEINQVRLATISGLFHDIGKLGIPKEILSKTTSLNDKEREIMKNHSKLGFDFLLSFPVDIRKIIIAHHEYDEFQSYPRKHHVEEGTLKLRENNSIIDTIAQIVAICDVYDALLNERSYKDAYPKEKVIEMLKNPKYLWDQNIILILEENI